jgi:Bacterial inner membrane protein.
MQNIELLTWIGYLASVVTAISLLMSTPLKLRWFNLVGSTIFATYGFLIGAYPVGTFNSLIIAIDAYYLVQIYKSTSAFQVLLVDSNERILQHFLSKYSEDISNTFPKYNDTLSSCDVIALQTRNMEVIGIVAGNKKGTSELEIEIDYTSPQNRDYKPGKYLFTKSSILKELGIKKAWAKAYTPAHKKYLLKMGFAKNSLDYAIDIS